MKCNDQNSRICGRLGKKQTNKQTNKKNNNQNIISSKVTGRKNASNPTPSFLAASYVGYELFY